MGTQDGAIIGITRVVDNGPASERFNIVLVSEGYQKNEVANFYIHCQQFVDKLFATAPFKDMRCAFNIYRLDVISSDSGANDPIACGGTGATPKTYFDATYCGFEGIRRALTVNATLARTVVEQYVPEWHQILVVVNSTIWGGTGGTVGTTSLAPDWEHIAIHEMGHTAFGLADEYPYLKGCDIDTSHDSYTGPEPLAPNVTTNIDRNTIKWRDLVLPSTPLPTTVNPDCRLCDTQTNPVPDGTVGAFEGALYHHCGVYRPEYNCAMRVIAPFCKVCQRRIRETLTPFVAVVCSAPVFNANNWFICIILNAIYLAQIAVLVIFSIFFPKLWCYVKQLSFKIGRCRKGNSDRCIKL